MASCMSWSGIHCTRIGMRYNEIIESADDDDDLFGRGLHHRIAAALLAQAEEDQRIADEERGLGDQIHRNVQNAEEFEEQARNYRYIADAFNQSMAQGVKVYRSLDRSWKGAVDDVVDIELDMDFRDYVKQIPESADDDELFGRTGGNFAGMSAQDVKDRWDELNDELYGYEAYWSDEDDAEFQQKESELKALMRYARIRFGEAFYQYLSNWREHSDAQYARWQERTRADPFNNRRYREDPRITKSGKINKQDQKTLARDIKDRVGTHRQPVLPENTDDDDLFSTSPKLDRRQELKAKTIRRIEKRDALNIQPGTRLMVKWDNGKYYKGKVVRLTPSGRVIAQVKFHNVGWPLEKNISPRDIKPEHILKETDDDMFSRAGEIANSRKDQLKQIVDPYQLTVQKVRELARGQFGVKTRVSGAPKKSARGRATFWFGDEPYDPDGHPTRVSQQIKAELEQRGFECQFTGSGWLSVKVPPMFSDLIHESESDDELFGQEDGARLALKLFKMLRAAVARDPRGVSDMLKQYNNENSTLEQRVQYTLDYMAQAVGMSREMFDHYSDDFYMMPWPKDVDWRRPWQVWDAQVLDRIIEIIRRIIYGRGMNESDDDELFATGNRTKVIAIITGFENWLKNQQLITHRTDPYQATPEDIGRLISEVVKLKKLVHKDLDAGLNRLYELSQDRNWAEDLWSQVEELNINWQPPWQR
jgi:hypothetical protein